MGKIFESPDGGKKVYERSIGGDVSDRTLVKGEESPKFKVGDKAYKPKGYKFPCTVVSIFKTTNGDTRIVGEMEDNGMLHIFNENQLEPLEIEIDTKKVNIYDPRTFEISKTVDTGVYLDFIDLIESSLDSSAKYELTPMTLDMDTHELLFGVIMNTGGRSILKYRIRIERLDSKE